MLWCDVPTWLQKVVCFIIQGYYFLPGKVLQILEPKTLIKINIRSSSECVCYQFQKGRVQQYAYNRGEQSIFRCGNYYLGNKRVDPNRRTSLALDITDIVVQGFIPVFL